MQRSKEMLPSKLIAAKYSAKRYGIGTPGGPAFLFVSPAPGEDFIEEDLEIIRALLEAYNVAQGVATIRVRQ